MSVEVNKKISIFKICNISLAITLIGYSFSPTAYATDIPNGTNLNTLPSPSNGETWDFLGDASASGSITFANNMTLNGIPTGSTITLNNGAGTYASLDTQYNSTLNLNNINLKDGKKTSGTDGVFNFSGTTTINGSSIVFENNQVGNRGGAIFSAGTITFTGKDITFQKNYSKGDSTSGGSAIYALGDINFTDTTGTLTLINNTSERTSAGLWSSGAIKISGNIYATGNKAGSTNSYGYSGAIRAGTTFLADNPNATLYFEKNSAYLGGGAMTVDSNAEFRSAKITFKDNQAVTGNGGAIFLSQNNTNIVFNNSNGQVIFEKNTAGNSGGAAYITTNFTSNFDQFSLIGNNAKNDGGALYIGGVVNINTSLGNISDNSTINGAGGAIAAQSNLAFTAGLGGINITNNTAGSLGGALYVKGSLNLDAKDGNITFSGNQHQTNSASTANAVYLNNTLGNRTVTLNAGNNHAIEFFDPIENNATNGLIDVNINDTAGRTGTVLFSGEKYTNAADRQSKIFGVTTVHMGTMELKANAEYGINGVGTSYTLSSGATLNSNAISANTVNAIHAEKISISGQTNFLGVAPQTLLLDGDVSNSGSISLANITPGNTLKITGDYTGNNGEIVLNTVLGSDASLSDKVIIGGDAKGSTKLLINNVGGAGDYTYGNGIEVVNVAGTSSAGAFSLSAPVTTGAYEYVLVPVNNNWYLSNTFIPITPTPPTPTPDGGKLLNPNAGSYLANQFAAQNMFANNILDEMLRKPNNRYWVTFQNSDASTDLFNGLQKADIDSQILQLGADVLKTDSFVLGIYTGIGQSSIDVTSNQTGTKSSGNVKGYSLGVYSSWTPEKTGLFVNGWGYYGWYRNKLTGDAQLYSTSYNSHGYSLNAQVGYDFPIPNTGWTVQPNARISYSGMNADDLSDSHFTRYSHGKANGFTGLIGAKLYGTLDMGLTPYLQLNYIHNSIDNKVQLDHSSLSTNLGKNVGEIRLGAAGNLNDKTNLWLNMGLQQGSQDFKRYDIKIGIAHEF